MFYVRHELLCVCVCVCVLDIGKFLLDMRFWLEQNFLDMGEFFFLLGMEFWLEQIFGQGKIFCKAWDFFFFGSEYFGMSNLWIS